MIIHVQFRFSQFISFREEDLWNFSQSEHIIGLGSHIEYPTGTKNSNFVEDHPRNIPAKFGSNRPSGFGEEAWNVKSLQTTDDGRQVMAIVHLDLWSRWTNKKVNIFLEMFSIHNLNTWYLCNVLSLLKLALNTNQSIKCGFFYCFSLNCFSTVNYIISYTETSIFLFDILTWICTNYLPLNA